MQPGQCVHSGGDIGISRHFAQGSLKLATKPDRWPGYGDVDCEIDQTGLDFTVAVMTDVDRRHATAPTRPHRFQNTRAPTQVTAKIVAIPYPKNSKCSLNEA